MPVIFVGANSYQNVLDGLKIVGLVFDGTAVDGLAGLRDYMASQRRADFLRQFSRKLLGYAVGRSVQLSDQPLIDDLSSTDGGQIGMMIERIVRSPQFREIRGSGP